MGVHSLPPAGRQPEGWWESLPIKSNSELDSGISHGPKVLGKLSSTLHTLLGSSTPKTSWINPWETHYRNAPRMGIGETWKHGMPMTRNDVKNHLNNKDVHVE